jgi:aminoglycoside phosphotransferase (APT) family kinase protein
MRRALYGTPVECGLVHGNFTASNILVDNAKVTGLVDWRFSRAAGLPYLDFLQYLHSVQTHCFPANSEVENLELLARETWPSKKEWDELRRQHGVFGIDHVQHRAFVYLNWVHRISRELQTYMVYEPKAIDARIVQVLKHIGSTRA